ncbi:MAG: BsaWI family type II restriction enzyme [Ignavibacterium sp.]|nr:BsaWI family type II restriction enzyme [Ignavibacterium sp.]
MITLDDSKAQSLRSSEGHRLENVVAFILNNLLNDKEIFIAQGTTDGLKKVVNDKKIIEQIIDYNKLPVKRPCDQKQLEDYPDTDLFILLKTKTHWRVLGVINCKVSFHSRHTMVTFWGLAVRIGSNIKYVCVTEDKDQYHPVRPRSEFGKSCEESTAVRRLLESFVDRTYIIKTYELNSIEIQKDIEKFSIALKKGTVKSICFDNPKHKYHTKYCVSVRPFDDLIFDIIRWKEEIDR